MVQQIRHLCIVLGDQLNRDSLLFDGFDKDCDLVWMAELDHESRHVPSHKTRIALFLSAMRHFRDELREEGFDVEYRKLLKTKNDDDTFKDALSDFLSEHDVDAVRFVIPGSYRVREELITACEDAAVPYEELDDNHFYTSPAYFEAWADDRKTYLLEHFYRKLRKEHGVLVDDQNKPTGGDWNFDKDNRESFGRDGPGLIPSPPAFSADETTREVIALVDDKFANNPGTLENFRWPVTRTDALDALNSFIKDRLPTFGDFQDAMWTDRPFLYHSLISSSLNLKLLNPREVIAKAIDAYENGDAPIHCVEGFVRQILGWREYVRGVYWYRMPELLAENYFDAQGELPAFYWDAETEFECLHQSISQTLEHSYAHHIQRLMVTGMFAMTLGVAPTEIHEWYLAVYVDAVEWVELPNVVAMSQYADGGWMMTKPYAASGKYIDRMSNYCVHCPKDPSKGHGEDACPFTALYWDFLARHEDALRENNRMRLQVMNLDRKDPDELASIRKEAARLRKELAGIDA
jgi:deoxyribodipyrimidine photolyase-related protein